MSKIVNYHITVMMICRYSYDDNLDSHDDNHHIHDDRHHTHDDRHHNMMIAITI